MEFSTNRSQAAIRARVSAWCAARRNRRGRRGRALGQRFERCSLGTIADDDQPDPLARRHRIDHLVDALPGHQPADGDELIGVASGRDTDVGAWLSPPSVFLPHRAGGESDGVVDNVDIVVGNPPPRHPIGEVVAGNDDRGRPGGYTRRGAASSASTFRP